MTLKLIHNLTKKEFELTGLEDLSRSRIWYTFDITLPEGMPNGEYTYTLYDGNVAKASGLLQVGEYVADKTNYNKDEIKEHNGYIQYE